VGFTPAGDKTFDLLGGNLSWVELLNKGSGSASDTAEMHGIIG
jgi:hypothetical protein